MEQELLAYMSQFIELEAHEKEFFLKSLNFQHFKKGSYLLKKGEIAQHCFFVIKGCVRKYYVMGGEEKTTAFYTEYQPINPISLTTQEPSSYYLACTEDCILSVGDQEKADELFREIPKFDMLAREFSNQMMIEQEIMFDDYHNLDPEMRYVKLMDKRPDLLQRVPQYQLASYLGIKPESLSRIRKRIREREQVA